MLNSVNESIVRLKVLKFSVIASSDFTDISLFTSIALTMFLVISSDSIQIVLSMLLEDSSHLPTAYVLKLYYG
jgi:hypothetical protein